MTRVLVAPDKFKGSLTAAQVAQAVERGLRRVRPDVEVVRRPVADGGEGTVDAALAAGFERVDVLASGPTGRGVRTAFARRGDLAVVEMADASGLSRLEAGPEPLLASSRGTGEVVAAALDAGCSRIVLGIGGSACTDGGAGLVSALGARVLDRHGEVVDDGGAALARADRLSLDGLHPALATAEVVVASDVDNPLLGERGAAAVYGPQKGAGADDVLVLDAALERWADAVAAATGHDHRGDPGAGAAGGVGFGALAVLGATLRPGIDIVMDLVGLRSALGSADLVITGEGSLDPQTLRGKAPAGVAAAAATAGVPTVAVCGQNLLTPAQLTRLGVVSAFALTDLEPDPSASMARAADLLERAAELVAEAHLGREVVSVDAAPR